MKQGLGHMKHSSRALKAHGAVLSSGNGSRLGSTRAGHTRTGSSERYDDRCVLFVAETPACARRIAEALSGGEVRARGTPPLKVYDCFAIFPPARCRCTISVTSCCGHLWGTELSASAERDTRERAGLDCRSIFFGSKSQRVVPCTDPARPDVREHLQREACGRRWLCLWTDCDAEGEAMALEVVRHLSLDFTPDRVWRARFSSLQPAAVLRALRAGLVKPDPAVAASFAARREVELKAGLAFSTLLTRCLVRHARSSFALPRLASLPFTFACSAALRMCVQRAHEAGAHVSAPYYDVYASVPLRPADATADARTKAGGGRDSREYSRSSPAVKAWPEVALVWTAGPIKSKQSATRVLKACTRVPTRDGRKAELQVRTALSK